MAPKRSVKTVCVTNNNNNYNNLTLNDVLCPICRSILIEPVTLPCNHGFCSSCFDGTVANTNLVCPLCRVRIGSWLRKSSKKDNKLVNNVLWDAIQKSFPTQVRNKLTGNEEYPVEEVHRRLTVPGEIRREYEIQKAKDLLELQKEREAESRASEDYIHKLKEQEEHEEKLRKENLHLSEQVAKKLAQECTYDPGPSSSKINLIPSRSSKKQLSIDKAIKKMNENKVTVTVQPLVENSLKKYSCKILCQDRDKKPTKIENARFDKATLLNWKIKDKLKKIITEGEASDSNDSITSECRYFKPIDQRFPSVPMKIPLIKVPAIVASANTVIIGPPKGEINFNHTEAGSAFVLMKTPTDVYYIEKQSSSKSKPQNSDVDISDTVITELIQSTIECSSESVDTQSPEKHVKCKTLEIFETSPSIKRYETRYNINNVNRRTLPKTPEKGKNLSQEFNLSSFTTPSKRKRLRSSPLLQKIVSPKKSKVADNTDRSSPPFLGFDNVNLNELSKKTNGAITVEAISVNNVNSKYEDNKITNKLKQLQEEEDFKLAQKLHEELNSRGRYSTRNSISVHNNNMKKKTPARQVTLKQMISHTVNKVP